MLDKQIFGDVAPRHRVNLQHGIQDEDQFAAIVDAFYVVMFTPYEGLLVKNWADFKATLTNSAVEALGGGDYQLQRKHTFGGVSLMRDITKPCNDGTVAVYDAGNNLLTSTIDYTTGIFTVSSGTPAKWVGKFDTPMTFEADKWEAELLSSPREPLRVSDPIWMEEVRGAP